MQTGFVVGEEWRLGRAFRHQGYRLRKNRLGAATDESLGLLHEIQCLVEIYGTKRAMLTRTQGKAENTNGSAWFSKVYKSHLILLSTAFPSLSLSLSLSITKINHAQPTHHPCPLQKHAENIPHTPYPIPHNPYTPKKKRNLYRRETNRSLHLPNLIKSRIQSSRYSKAMYFPLPRTQCYAGDSIKNSEAVSFSVRDGD